MTARERPLLLTVGMFAWPHPAIADPVRQMVRHFAPFADVVFMSPIRRLGVAPRLGAELASGLAPVFWVVDPPEPTAQAVRFLRTWAVPVPGYSLYPQLVNRRIILYAHSYSTDLEAELTQLFQPHALIYDVYENVVDPAAPLVGHDALLAAATLRVAITPSVAAHLPPPYPANLVWGAGVDPDQWRSVRHHPGPFPYAFGFFGNFANWVDVDSLAAVAARYPDERILLIGSEPPWPSEALGKLRAQANVDWRPAMPYQELRRAVAGVEVFLLPRRRDPAALASDPIKLWDYLATGRPIVSTRLPVVEALGAAVYVADSPAQFADLAGRALQEHRGEEAGERATSRVNLARAHSWQARAWELLRRVGVEVPG